MDALAVMRAEIERKRKDAEAHLGGNSAATGKRFFRRGEMEEKSIAEAYEKKKVAAEAAAKEAEAIACSVDATAHSKGGAAADDDSKDSDKGSLPLEELIRRLRHRQQPIKLFGESAAATMKRLRQLEILDPEASKRQRNDYQDAMEDVAQSEIKELMQRAGDPDAISSSKKETRSHADIVEMAKSLGQKNSNTDNDQKIIRAVFRYFIRLWGQDLDQRPIEMKRDPEGKRASATYKQTEIYLEPLLKLLKKRECDPNICHLLTELVGHLLQREYVHCNDAYLRMAIGKAAWPIGVTNVGIHSRTGREKIFAQNIAHVLNDETQRKYIQAIKRIMTYSQHRFTADPSKCIDFYRGMDESHLYYRPPGTEE